jgi:hypothetical protein
MRVVLTVAGGQRSQLLCAGGPYMLVPPRQAGVGELVAALRDGRGV